MVRGPVSFGQTYERDGNVTSESRNLLPARIPGPAP